MRPWRPCVLAALTAILVMSRAAPAPAQTVEVAPVAGYRFGGDLFELAANHALDIDGAPAFGGALSVEMANGLWFEALFTHQQADVEFRQGSFGPTGHVRAVVDQWLAGGRQDLDLALGRAQPFVTGFLGLTHYGADGDHEIRFMLGGGGGIKFPLARHLAVRLDGRVFTTFVDVNGAAACSGGCLVGVNVNVVWQGEGTAGLVFVF
jgi:hypothetical protein